MLRTCCIWGASGTSTWRQCSSDVTELELSEKLRARAVELGFILIPEAVKPGAGDVRYKRWVKNRRERKG